jgi:hypothetical protein
MRFYIEEHKYKNNDINYILWFDHETGLAKVKCGIFYDLEKALIQLDLEVEKYNWPKITLVKEVKL